MTIRIILVPYSIASGIALGIVSCVLVKPVIGKPDEVHPVMYVLAILFAVGYWWGPVA